ncbi:MAG: phosphoglycolate phosphatase [Nitrososphaerales archaeon]
MDLRGLVVDIDGTLTEENGTIGLQASTALRSMKAKGYEVILASGRGPWDTFALAMFLGLTKAVVAENGGVIVKSPKDVRLLAEQKESLEALELLKSKIPELKVKNVFPRLTEVVLERTFDIEVGRKTLGSVGMQIVINDSLYGYHLNHADTDKGNALKILAKDMSLDLKGMVAIGDSDLDIPMFNACGYSIALANATPPTKAASNHVVARPMADGLLEALDHIATLE